jgi:hypothetical protein
LLSLFRTNQALANILLLFYIALLRGILFYTGEPLMPEAAGIWSFEFYRWVGKDLWLLPWFSISIILFQAIFVNYIAARYRLSEEITLFSGSFYILLCSGIGTLGNLPPALMANSFLIVVIYLLFDSYRQNNPAAAIFNIGLWVGIGSLFQFSFFLFVLLGIIGLNIVRSWNTREMLMLLAGITTTYFLCGSVYYLCDAFPLFLEQQFTSNLAFLNFNLDSTAVSYIERGLVLMLVVVAILSQGVYAYKRNIQVQKFQSILYWALIIAAFSAVFQAQASTEQLVFLMPTLAFFMMYHFTRLKSEIAETLHLVWVLLVIALQLHQFLGF